MTVALLIVDDHPAFRAAIAYLLAQEPGLSVTGQAGTMAEATAMIQERPFDLATIDLDLPDGFGGNLIRLLRRRNPDAAALVLTASRDRRDHARAIEAGAAHVMLKSAPIADIVAAIRRLAAGEELLPPQQVIELLRFAAERTAAEQSARQALATLTPRELETIQALADGLDNAAIAARFSVSGETVRVHVRNILAKLDVDSRLQAVLLALRYGAVTLD